VSLDPDPINPRGPVMLLRGDDALIDTHVLWVLFESDRIMKAYSLGQDNVTLKPVTTPIPGYQDLFDFHFEGDRTDSPDESVWERFWIVPGTVVRRRDAGGEVTLLGVDLKVNTQRMS